MSFAHVKMRTNAFHKEATADHKVEEYRNKLH